MKLERLSENQIRCTLSGADLSDRDITLNELASGNQKTHEFIREIMEQASDEFGFDAAGKPLIIETKRVGAEKIIFTLTKIDRPEDFLKLILSQALKEISMTVSGGDGIREMPESGEGPEEPPATFGFYQDPAAVADIFSFDRLSVISDLANSVQIGSCDRSFLYKDDLSDTYYLVLEKDRPGDEAFRRLCLTAGEFGIPIYMGPESHAFFEEHLECLAKGDALEVMKRFA
ncbi:MAG: adaptor protein MecA [Lachnospiraceae bacterium]|nr:adaptor protein MecA [Lachnospiraceae bacterium]